jgi:hypothetical protein
LKIGSSPRDQRFLLLTTRQVVLISSGERVNGYVRFSGVECLQAFLMQRLETLSPF